MWLQVLEAMRKDLHGPLWQYNGKRSVMATHSSLTAVLLAMLLAPCATKPLLPPRGQRDVPVRPYAGHSGHTRTPVNAARREATGHLNIPDATHMRI